MSLSWCKQDTDLLLSCGKDNRTICWNPQTGEMLGEFPTVTNWTFKTEWNPRNPSLSATASYDGKIVIQTLQNTNPSASAEVPGSAGDADDFFSRASNAQTSSFTLKQPPKWLKVPVGASFGFGGKLISFSASEVQPGQKAQSIVKISTFAVDSGVNSATESFEKALKEGNLVNICDQRAKDAKTDQEKSDWNILRSLFKANPRQQLIEYLGFNNDEPVGLESESEKVETNGKPEVEDETSDGKDKRLSSFFADSGADSDSFLADLSSIQSTHGAKTNNPFQIFTGGESEEDRRITHAIVLGQFDKAVDICLKEDRISDAFMLAICGGEKCIKKVKTAYFKVKGPNYLRILASVVGKNLWDVVHNADLANWKEVVAALCTFANEKDFPELCEALGDRLEDELRRGQGDKEARKHAAFCYLAGSKLEKVTGIWIEEFQEGEQAGLQETEGDSTFSMHARSLQNFIEKVTVFREAVKFVDDEKGLSANWKLQALYEKYCEYADIVASQGQLDVASRYLELLPVDYPAAKVARNRVKEASGKAPAATPTLQVRGGKTPSQQPQPGTNAYGGLQAKSPYQLGQPPPPPAPVAGYQSQAPAPTPYAPAGTTVASNQYTPAGTAPVSNPYTPAGTAVASNPYNPTANMTVPGPYASSGSYAPGTQTTGYKPSTYGQSSQPMSATGSYGGAYQQFGQASGFQPPGFQPPPQRQFPPPASGPPPPPRQSLKDVGNWNDTPDVVKIPRRATPSTTPAPVTSPFPNTPNMQSSPPMPSGPFQGGPPSRVPTAPPPRGALAPQSPAHMQYSRSHSPAIQQAGPYGPPTNQSFPPPAGPYGPPANQSFPPPTPGYHTSAPPTGRYAPTPGTPGSVPPGRTNAALPPPPQGSAVSRTAGASQGSQYSPAPTAFGQPPAVSQYAPAPHQHAPMYGHPPGSAPPSGQYGPPPGGAPPPRSHSVTQQSEISSPPKAATPVPSPKHPAGDRSHIPSQYVPIYELLTADLERVKQRAPPAFQRQVKDTEKRLGILFDHINNEELLSPEALEAMLILSRGLFPTLSRQ